MSKKILHLTIKRKWFDLIAQGKKTVEFREIKPYWTKRLRGKEFDEVHFRNGYRKDSPFMRVQWIVTGTNVTFVLGSHLEENEIPKTIPHYSIYLGEILEIKNWEIQ